MRALVSRATAWGTAPFPAGSGGRRSPVLASIFVTAPRPLDPNERTLLDGFLAPDFDGVAALRDQVRGVRGAPGCTCGCGSLDLFVDATSPASTAASPIPSEGIVLDNAGDEVGGPILFLVAGHLSYMEVYSFFDPLPLPPAEQVQWTAG